MSLLQKMQALKVSPVKPRYHLVDGDWQLKPEPVVTPVVEVVTEDWPICGAPKVGKPCPKCIGSEVYVFQDGRKQTCHWCTHGRGIISPRDKRNFDRRIMQKLPMNFIITAAA